MLSVDHETIEHKGSTLVICFQFWNDGTVPTKECVSMHLPKWKDMCHMLGLLDDMMTREIARNPSIGVYNISEMLKHLTHFNIRKY